jgi:hypothetical protein
MPPSPGDVAARLGRDYAPISSPAENPCVETEDAHSGSHLLAACGTATASIGAFPHLTNPLTIRGASFADFGAFTTGEFVKVRAEQHEMRRRPTNLGASHHQGEVLGLGMLTADLQTMTHRRRQARLITAQTFGYAALHLIVDHRHRIRCIYNLRPDLTGRDVLETRVCCLGSPGCPTKGLRTLMAKAR